MSNCTKLVNSKRQEGFLDLITDGPQFRLTFLEDGMFRVRGTWDAKFAPERSYTLVKTAWPDELDDFMGDERIRVEPLAAVYAEDEKTISLKTALLEVKINKEPFGIAVYDLTGREIHSDVHGKAYDKDHLGRVYHYSQLEDGNGYYGFGEKTGVLDKSKKRLRMSNKDTIGYDPIQADPLYKHIPFYIVLNRNSKIAHGIFYHNSYEANFDVGAERSGYWPPYTYFTADGGDIEWFFCYGPTVKAVIERYTDLTGKTVLPPRYSLGYMGSSMYYTELSENSDKAVLGFIDRAKAEEIPCEGFFLSSGYTSGGDNKRYVLEWHYGRFPNPAQFVAQMQAKGAELCPNVKPGMLLSHPRYRNFAEHGGYIMDRTGKTPRIDRFWGGPASFVDFTSPNGRKLWKQGLHEALLSNGINAIWNDNCEYESQDLSAVCYGDGQPQLLAGLQPVFANLMAKMAREAMAEARPAIRPYILNRAGFAGIQRYAATWCGDNMTSWDSLKYNIPTMLGMGLSGVANQGSDIGGFAGPRPEPELLVRWVQQGVFQPRFCIHSCNDDNTVTEPWMYPDYTDYIQRALKFRYELMPYLYSLLYEASQTGAPFMRPLFYEFQEDRNVYGESFDYLCGPSLLVANVLEKGAVKRSIYLPKGAYWREWGSWNLYEGGQVIEVEAPLDKIPLFVRSGSIIPLTEGVTNLRMQPIKKIHYLLEPGSEGQFTLYEDDGESQGYLQGDYLTTQIAVKPVEQTVIIDFTRNGNYQSPVTLETLRVICPEKAPLEVWIGDILLPRLMVKEVQNDQQPSWYYDAQEGVAHVMLPRPRTNCRVRMEFASKDLISI